MHLLRDYLLCWTKGSAGQQICWGSANNGCQAFSAESSSWCWMHAVCKSGRMPALGVVLRGRASFHLMIHWVGEPYGRCQPWAPNPCAGLRLSSACWALHRRLTKKGHAPFTARNKWPRVRYTTLRADPGDWLLRCNFCSHRNHFSADCRCCFRACAAHRLARHQKIPRLSSVHFSLVSPHNEYTRPSRSFDQFQHCLLCLEYLQNESSATALVRYMRSSMASFVLILQIYFGYCY